MAPIELLEEGIVVVVFEADVEIIGGSARDEMCEER
jgi:hypothetical protein